jgi:hypothetical protein
MVLQQPFDSAPAHVDQTLASLWRSHARRADRRIVTQCIAFGTFGTIVSLYLGRLTFLAMVSLVVASFGSYAAVVQPGLVGRRLSRQTQRTIAVLLATVAALAALIAGLLVLEVIFGGSIEVMRR